MVLVEEIVQQPHIFELVPWAYRNRAVVEVVDLCARDAQKQRRVSGHDQLCPAYRAGRKESDQIELQIRRQAVFRFIEQVKPALGNCLGEINEGAFPVGVFATGLLHAVAYEAPAGAAAGFHVGQERIEPTLFPGVEPRTQGIFGFPLAG